MDVAGALTEMPARLRVYRRKARAEELSPPRGQSSNVRATCRAWASDEAAKRTRGRRCINNPSVALFRFSIDPIADGYQWPHDSAPPARPGHRVVEHRNPAQEHCYESKLCDNATQVYLAGLVPQHSNHPGNRAARGIEPSGVRRAAP